MDVKAKRRPPVFNLLELLIRNSQIPQRILAVRRDMLQELGTDAVERTPAPFALSLGRDGIFNVDQLEPVDRIKIEPAGTGVGTLFRVSLFLFFFLPFPFAAFPFDRFTVKRVVFDMNVSVVSVLFRLCHFQHPLKNGFPRPFISVRSAFSSKERRLERLPAFSAVPSAE